MHFLIVLIAIAVLESNAQLAFIQRDLWVQKWHSAVAKFVPASGGARLNILVYVLVPVALLQLVLLNLGNGILVFLLELAVLLYSFGRGDLSAQIKVLESDIERSDLQAAFHDAAVFNIGHRASSASSAEGLYRELTSALPYRLFERTFVAVFWFFFLGAPAALAYRLLALHGDMELDAEVMLEPQVEQASADQNVSAEEQVSAEENGLEAATDTAPSSSYANKLLWLLEWLPVRFLALTLGLMGDFSQATLQLKELVFCTKTSTADVLRLCVLGALAKEAAPQDVDKSADDTAALLQVAEMVALFRRSMTGWLVVIALLVLIS